MSYNRDNVREVLASVPNLYRGPGGAVAVIKDGQLLDRRVWGFADFEKRIETTPDTIMPICSISKQMLCAVMLDLAQNPSTGEGFMQQLNDRLQQVLPAEMLSTGLNVNHMCNNASGIRDYWALTVLWGAYPEQRFSVSEDAPRALERMKSLHFEPGTEYSYCNFNFYLVARIIEHVSGRSLGDLLQERVFDPAGMKTAQLAPDTAKIPPPGVGYEGDEKRGYIPAINGIEWSGDAGIVASLNDMVAYEMHVDKLSQDPNSWYTTASTPPTYKDGTRATYGNGLAFETTKGMHSSSHGGGLRGWSLYRTYIKQERLSVVVMLNHEAQAKEVVTYILNRLLQIEAATIMKIKPADEWAGTYLDEGTMLAITVKPEPTDIVAIDYARAAEKVRLTDSRNATSTTISATINGDLLKIARLSEHRQLNARRVHAAPCPSIVGVYTCEDIDSTMHCVDLGGMLYVYFDGFLGTGPAHLVRHLASNVWIFACPRAMDSAPPGDWTMVAHNDDKVVSGLTVGCWLARKLSYVRKE